MLPEPPDATMAGWHVAPLRDGTLVDHGVFTADIGSPSAGFLEWIQGLGGGARVVAVPHPDRPSWNTTAVMFEREEDMVLYQMTYPMLLAHHPMWMSWTVSINYDQITVKPDDAAS